MCVCVIFGGAGGGVFLVVVLLIVAKVVDFVCFLFVCLFVLEGGREWLVFFQRPLRLISKARIDLI